MTTVLRSAPNFTPLYQVKTQPNGLRFAFYVSRLTDLEHLAQIVYETRWTPSRLPHIGI